MTAPKITLAQALLLPQTVWRAVKVSLIIGTLLILINQGDLLLAGSWPPVWKILLTYLVPYGVASYAAADIARDRSLVESGANQEGDVS